MKWVGYLATILVMQLALVAIFLQIRGRFPSHELGLVWQAILKDPAEDEGGSGKDPKLPPPPEVPSYEDIREERLIRSPEIAQKIDELGALQRAIEQQQAELKKERQVLEKIQQSVVQTTQTELDKAVAEGEAKLLDLLVTMKAKQAKEYLLADSQEDRILRTLMKMEPVSAEKIFREFKQPEETRKLHGWLDRLGQGDPKAAQLKQLLEQATQNASESSTASSR